jgi:glucose-1-phosphate cytidylyltransferase
MGARRSSKVKNGQAEGKWAVVLCGGRGSRMGPMTDDRPKPLIEVHGKPILWYVFLSLYRHGIRNFIFPIGYKGKMIENYILDVSQKMDCNVLCQDTGEDSSIASRIAQVAHLLPEHADFLILNSDTIFDFDLGDMYRTHRASNALVTLSSVEVVSSWGLILLDGDKLVGFDRERKVHRMISKESPSLQGVVNSGVAWLNKDALDVVDLSTCYDFETSLYSALIKMGRAAHYRLKGCWFPIDSPKDLQIVNLAVDDRHSSGHLAREVKDRLVSVERTNAQG